MFPHCLVKHSPSDTNRFLCSPPPVALILTILIFIQVETVHGCEEQAITESKQIDINLSIEKDDFLLQNQSVVLAAHKQKETLEENLQGCSSGSPAAHGSSRLGRSLGQLGQDAQEEILILVGAEQDQTGPTRLAEISCPSHKIQNGHLAKFVFVVGIFSTLLAVLQQNGAWLLPKTSTKLLLPSHSHMRSSSEDRSTDFNAVQEHSAGTPEAPLSLVFLCRTGRFLFSHCSISHPGTDKFLMFATTQR